MSDLKAFEKFNEIASEFLTKIVNTFPNEQQIHDYKLAFDGMRFVNPKTPVGMFMATMEDCGSQILTRNEDFFKQDTYVKAAENVSGRFGLVSIWESIDPKTKDAIWSYLGTLFALGMKCQGREQELKQLLISLQKR